MIVSREIMESLSDLLTILDTDTLKKEIKTAYNNEESTSIKMLFGKATIQKIYFHSDWLKLNGTPNESEWPEEIRASAKESLKQLQQTITIMAGIDPKISMTYTEALVSLQVAINVILEFLA